MTPVAVLAAFCASITAVAVARLALAPRRDPVETGTTLLVAGVTTFAALWALLDADAASAGSLAGLAGVGLAAAAAGLWTLERHW